MSIKSTPLFQSIGFTLLKHAFGSYVIVALLVTSFQAWEEYQLTQNQTSIHLRESQKVVENGLATALWHLDQPLLDDILKGILSSSTVVGVRILDMQNKVFSEQGQMLDTEITASTTDSPLIHTFKLIDPTADSEALIGSVELYSSPSVVFQTVKPTLVSLVISATIKTLALWIIFIYFGNKLLALPLNKLAQLVYPNQKGRSDPEISHEDMNEIEKLGIAILNMQELSDRKLTRSEQKLQQILDTAGEGIMVLDEKGLISYTNPVACQLLGWSAKEMLSKNPHDFLHEKQGYNGVEREESTINTTFRTALKSSRDDAIFVHKNGTSFSVSLNSSPIIESNKITGVVMMFEDISDRKLQEKLLRESRKTYQTLLDNLPEGVIFKDTDSVYISGNRSYAQRVGLHPHELTRKIAADLFPAEQAQKYEEADRQVIENGKSIKYEESFTLNGIEQHTQTISTPVKNQLGEVNGVLTIIWDISHIKQAEKERQLMEVQLHQAQKLESVGQLAAGIAHEINTPVQYVNDNTYFLKEAFEDYSSLLLEYQKILASISSATDQESISEQVEKLNEQADYDYLKNETPKAFEQSLNGLKRISKIVQAMKEFSHTGSKEKRPTDLNKAIQSTIDVSRNEWKYNAELVTEFDDRLPLISVLPDEFNQVILNLIINAAHAIGDTSRDRAPGEIKISTGIEKDTAIIRVADNGSGIPENIRSRIFDPFFTTKEVGKGTGQGLAIAYSAVVDKHEGSIEVETEENLGSTFTIKLPVKPLQQQSTHT